MNVPTLDDAAEISLPVIDRESGHSAWIGNGNNLFLAHDRYLFVWWRPPGALARPAAAVVSFLLELLGRLHRSGDVDRAIDTKTLDECAQRPYVVAQRLGIVAKLDLAAEHHLARRRRQAPCLF